MVDDVNTLLQTISDSRNDNVRKKCDRVLKTNPDFVTLRQIYDVLSTLPAVLRRGNILRIFRDLSRAINASKQSSSLSNGDSFSNSNQSSSEELWWLFSLCRESLLSEEMSLTFVLWTSDMALVRKNVSRGQINCALSDADLFISLGDFFSSSLMMLSSLFFSCTGDTDVCLGSSSPTSVSVNGEWESTLSGVYGSCESISLVIGSCNNLESTGMFV
ncbi:hypothetical protein NQ318_008260 [Aromia moschata]|uniref:Uncharacterized protein n=1 Tax=Aromia moschata TaxID=1265417 RepID=A0AAV8Y5Z3_9CUCU|nr:hypothetical protein NQ318_008260 [Aromia moschata]